jgi:hypothetical protein
MWRLAERVQQRCANGADRGNLAQQLGGVMLPALDQQLASHLLVQEQQGVELLVVKLRPAAHAGFGDFRQPLCPAAPLNLLASTGNGPASVQRLQSNHHSRQTSGDGHITARQFLHGPDAAAFVIHRAQQLGQLAGIAAITFISGP